MLGQLGKRDGGLQGTRRSKAQWNRGWGEEIAPLRVGCRNACSQAKKVRARREGRLRVGRGEAGGGGRSEKQDFGSWSGDGEEVQKDAEWQWRRAGRPRLPGGQRGIGAPVRPAGLQGRTITDVHNLR